VLLLTFIFFSYRPFLFLFVLPVFDVFFTRSIRAHALHYCHCPTPTPSLADQQGAEGDAQAVQNQMQHTRPPPQANPRHFGQ